MTSEELANLTPIQKRIKIAEACGWTAGTNGWFNHQCQPGRGKKSHQLPDYLTDLNAMAEAEHTLPVRQRGRYALKLAAILGDTYLDTFERWWHPVTATASQRAEAFLLTID